MSFWAITLLITSQLWAAEVATIQRLGALKDIQISVTDDELFAAAEKLYVAHPCRFRTVMGLANNLREITVPGSCRAEVTKFFINAGYKPLDSRTFVK